MEIRYFNFPTSVFANFRADDERAIQTILFTDTKQWKVPKFLKCEHERDNLYAMVKKHLGTLKSQFIRLISVHSYPVIDWIAFVKECTKWDMIGHDLLQTDIDRIFIATNYEEEDLE